MYNIHPFFHPSASQPLYIYEKTDTFVISLIHPIDHLSHPQSFDWSKWNKGVVICSTGCAMYKGSRQSKGSMLAIGIYLSLSELSKINLTKLWLYVRNILNGQEQRLKS